MNAVSGDLKAALKMDWSNSTLKISKNSNLTLWTSGETDVEVGKIFTKLCKVNNAEIIARDNYKR